MLCRASRVIANSQHTKQILLKHWVVAECGVSDLVQFRGVPTDEELIECYQQCDLFALPNRQVGWDFGASGSRCSKRRPVASP